MGTKVRTHVYFLPRMHNTLLIVLSFQEIVTTMHKFVVTELHSSTAYGLPQILHAQEQLWLQQFRMMSY